jgi:hypothetical protein
MESRKEADLLFGPEVQPIPLAHFLILIATTLTDSFLRGGDQMRCFRCGKIMLHEKFHGSQESFWGWKCLYCGDIVDQIILENRFQSTQGRRDILGRTSDGLSTSCFSE